MPVDELADAVDVLLELPDQPALADAAGPGDADQPRAGLASDGMQHVLELAQLLVTAGERGLEGVGAALPAALRDDPDGTPRRDRARLALQRVVAQRLEHDRALGPAPGGVADEHGAGLRDALKPGGGVDQVAGDHALVGGAQRHRGLSGEDAGAGLEAGMQGRHRGDDLERGPDRAFRVVLVRGRRAPHRHHRVADELLHRPAVQRDRLRGGVEVARKQVAYGLRVTILGERREADEIGEQDGDQPTLGGRLVGGAHRGWRGGGGRGAGCWCVAAQRRAAVGAEARIGAVGLAAGRTVRSEGAPQLSQKRLPVRFSVPHDAQITQGPPWGSSGAYPMEASG